MNVVCLTFGWMELAQAKSSAFSLVNFLGIFTFFIFFSASGSGGQMSTHAKCNLCWRELEECAYITRCSHIFCERDAHKSINAEGLCPLCDTPLQGRGGVTLVDFTPASSFDKAIQLCGLAPSSVMSLATKALEFWDYQKQTELEYQKMSLKNQQMRLQSVEKQCNDKMVDAQNKINVLSHQLNSLKEELETSKKDLIDLQQKYAERTRQKRKLAELYECLKQRYEGGNNNRPNNGSPIFLGKSLVTSPRAVASPFGSTAQSNPKFDGVSFSPRSRDQETVRQQPENDRFSLLRRQSPTGRSASNRFLANSRPAFRPVFAPKRPETPLLSRHLANDNLTRSPLLLG